MPNITDAQAVAQMSQETLFSVAERLLNKVPNNEEAKARIHGRLFSVKQEIDKFVAEASKDRIAELEAQLAQLCAEGEDAQDEYVEASNKETVVRKADAMRQNRYAAAARALANFKNTPLPEFHTNKHLLKRLDDISRAQAELDNALAELEANPNAIPTVVFIKKQAHLKVDALVAKVRAVRRELSALKGEDAPQTASVDSDTGLGGMR